MKKRCYYNAYHLVIAKNKLKRQHEKKNIEKEIETMRVAVEQYENGHPHIVRLLCTKESQHFIFIVLEFCFSALTLTTYLYFAEQLVNN